MTETMELEPDEFWRMVTEENLKTDGPSAGFMWTGKQGVAGWEMYKTRANNIGWLYQAQRVTTNTNAAGAAIVVDITVPTGVVAKLIALNAYSVTTATHTLFAYLEDEDFTGTNHNVVLANTGAAAAAKVISLPSIGSAATASANIMNTLGMVLGPGQSLTIAHGDASGVANDHIDIFVTMLMSKEVQPTWSKARSGNAANTTIAASTISAANTLQAVYLWPSLP